MWSSFWGSSGGAGTLLLRQTYRAPFAISVPSSDELVGLLGLPRTARLVAFHCAEAGSFEIRIKGARPVVVESGEVVLCFGGSPHHLARGECAVTRTFASLLADRTRPFGPVHRRGLEESRIICGALAFHDTWLNPLFASLPGVLRFGRGDDLEASRLESLTSMLSAEFEQAGAASEYVVERLIELICAEGIRSRAQANQGEAGWFRGLADQNINGALSAFHGAPGQAWSVDRLARRSHLSPSRFSARFREATGMTPMSYVARWRMNLAMRSLASTDRGVAEIAAEVGYESLPAFSRAFKKHVGRPPATYRTERAAAR